MTNHDDRDASWIPVFDASSTRADVDAAIEEWVGVALADVHAQLAAMPVTDGERRQMAAQVEPIVRSQTRAALEAGWQQLQVDAASAGGTIH